jgi:multicomponent K+:H+ antiporter subunit E
VKRPVAPPQQPSAPSALGWLPHPGLSLLLAAVWLLLQHSLAAPQLITAALLGWAVPRLLIGFLADAPGPVANTGTGTGTPKDWHQRLARLGTAVRLCAVVLQDIVAGNLAVARLVLWPGAKPKPGWVTVPLDLTHPDAILLLALIITNTPGTVSCVVDEAARQIVVHVLDLDDPAALVAEIKQRYEQPIQEIFR